MPKIALVGEAYGAEEEKAGRPFVGTSGYILDQMLAQVGIDRSECLVTNVFNLRPKPSNDIKNLCGPRTAGIPGLPEVQKGKFIRKEFANELTRLGNEIEAARPNVIIALGATANWATCGTTGIRNSRGAIVIASLVGRGTKVLPTYHPAAVARQWELRPIVIADLDKAKRESEYAEFRRPKRKIYIAETLDDLRWFTENFIREASLLSIDIETKMEQITCIGFAPSPEVACVIPIVSASGKSYWEADCERLVWNYIRQWCTYPSLFQNGMYDIQYLWRRYGIACPNAIEDTMLMHHAMQPEMEKGLGFLASIYTDEASWKNMRKAATLKKDD